MHAGAFTIDEADLAACRALIRQGSKSFFAASLLLPGKVRRPATALYAFCRVADDAIDEAGADSAHVHAALADLHDRLDAIYAGRPRAIAADRAFAAVTHAYHVPQALPAALIEGFAWDAAGRRYGTLGELRAYAARVASSVGAMMAILMGVRDPVMAARACDLGVAMQLTNIARDVGEDARAGRLYLPQAWLRDAGIDPDAFLARPAFSPALGEVVARLLAEADSLYRRADAGIAGLPGGCRPGIGAASRIYQAIGAEIAARGHDSVNHRAVVPTGRKLRLAAGTVVAPVVESEAPALPETGFLVDALRAAAAERPSRSEGVAWVLDLFLKLEERDVMQRAEGRP